jgi:hypothetical protein
MTTVDKVLAACMAANTPAQFAKAFGKTDGGRSVRNTLRTRFGVRVSDGDAFDDAVKSALYAHLSGDAEALKGYLASK